MEHSQSGVTRLMEHSQSGATRYLAFEMTAELGKVVVDKPNAKFYIRILIAQSTISRNTLYLIFLKKYSVSSYNYID